MKLKLPSYTINSSSAAEIVQTSTPKRTSILRPPIPPSLLDTPSGMTEKDSAFLKTLLTMLRPNLDASIEAAEEENEKILRDIVDPTPGFVVDDNFTDSDLANAANENEVKFQLGNSAQKRLDTILDEINKSISFENQVFNLQKN